MPKSRIFFYRSTSIIIQRMDYKQIYEKIMDADPNIRLVTICDPNGKIMYPSHKEGERIF